jgi:spermidine/putrescine transport system ATP-binding protein
VTFYTVELEAGAVVRAMLPNADPERPCRFEVEQAVALDWRDDAGHFLPA